MTYTYPSTPNAPSRAIRVDVRKDGRLFIGDLIWSDGSKWLGWQVFKTLKALTSNARCTFDGPIVRV